MRKLNRWMLFASVLFALPMFTPLGVDILWWLRKFM
jgi:hypothetical protein